MLIHFIAFALVGVIGTAAHYSVLYVLVEYYAISPVMASGWGALAGLFINYVLNYRLTFKSTQSHRQTFPKFAAIALLGLAVNLVLMSLLTPRFYYLLAQIITTLVVLIWNFLANRFWTFQLDMTENTTPTQLTEKSVNIFNSLALIAFICIIRLLTLGFYPLYDPSESRYAEMGRKMLEVGDWITPMIDYGIPFWGKPPMTIWLTAASLGLGGINDFSARLPSFLLSLGIGWIVFALAKKQRDSDYAWHSVIIMASSVLFFVMAGTVAMDICLNFGITLALASFWLAVRGEKPLWGYLFFVGLSIGLMSKGPITLVLSGITLGLWSVVSGEWLKIWQRIPWIKGTLLMLCLSMPWYLIAEQKTPGFLNYFIIGEHWKRFTEKGWTGDLYGNGHAHPHGMIWVYWLAATFPWCFVLFQRGIVGIIHKNAGELLRSNDGWRLFCVCWMLSPLLFFTLSANIIWTYALPSIAGFALLLADLTKQSKYRPVFALSMPMVFLALVIAYQFPQVSFYKSQKRLIDSYQKTAKADEKLFYFIDRPYSGQFYAQGKAIELKDVLAVENSLTDQKQHFYIVKKDHLPMLPETIKQHFEEVKSYGKYSLFHQKH
jgi:putative flippase GtrA